MHVTNRAREQQQYLCTNNDKIGVLEVWSEAAIMAARQ